MNGYEKRTKAKKDAIITVARRLFLERGMTAVGISEIASQAGVSPMSIYNYFGDKQALAREALAVIVDEMKAAYTKIIESDVSFAEKCRLLSEQKNRFRSEMSSAFVETLAWDDKATQQLCQELAAETSASLLLRLIDEGKRAGEVDPDIPSEAILDYITALESIIGWRHLVNKGEDYRGGLGKLFRYGLYGMRNQTPEN